MREKNERARAPRAAGMAVLGATLLGATPAFAELPAFGMMTVARTQRVLLHGVLTQPPDPLHPGCQVQASFVDAQGRVLTDAAGNAIVERWDLRGNVSQTLRLRMDAVLPEDRARALIHPVVQDVADPAGSAGCCSLTLTVEVVNTGGDLSHLGLPRAPNPPSPFCVAIGGTR